MRWIVSAMLLVVGLIHLLPLSGVIGAERLTVLYGLPFNDPSLEVLMRHRAVLFGLLGLFFVFSAFKPNLQTIAFISGLASVLSFLYLAWSIGGYNSRIERVFVADVVALVCLTIGGGLHAYRQRGD